MKTPRHLIQKLVELKKRREKEKKRKEGEKEKRDPEMNPCSGIFHGKGLRRCIDNKQSTLFLLPFADFIFVAGHQCGRNMGQTCDSRLT